MSDTIFVEGLPKSECIIHSAGYGQPGKFLNDKLKTIKAEEIGGAKRYVIGHFENVMDALQFSNDIKALGINDAFVSQYTNGVRNMDYDALEAIGEK